MPLTKLSFYVGNVHRNTVTKVHFELTQVSPKARVYYKTHNKHSFFIFTTDGYRAQKN